jgi:hypothetical protein
MRMTIFEALRFYAISETALVKNGLCGAATVQIIGVSPVSGLKSLPASGGRPV